VEESQFGRKYHEKIDYINESIDPWEERDNPDNPFRSSRLCFGGQPTSQQEARRYGDVSAYPFPSRMTPFVGFTHPAHDMDYQIYTPSRPAPETADSTYYGKVDASCT
jgi:hypothetical protein